MLIMGDIMYDQPEFLCDKTESVQYKDCHKRCFTRFIMGKTLNGIREIEMLRRLCHMFKIMKNQAPEY